MCWATSHYPWLAKIGNPLRSWFPIYFTRPNTCVIIAIYNSTFATGSYSRKFIGWLRLSRNAGLNHELNIARKNADSNFESDLAKLQANATFSKTMEQVRNRLNLHLICDPIVLSKALSRPSFRQAEIINNDFTMVHNAKQRVTLNKPITVGFAILEISKLIMYQFYYDYLKPTCGNNCKLLFTDTDSFCCHIQTDDLWFIFIPSWQRHRHSQHQTMHTTSVCQQSPLRTAENSAQARRALLRLRRPGCLEVSAIIHSRTAQHRHFQTAP